MTTMAFPITALENSVRVEAEKALAATESMVSHSKEMAADIRTVYRIFVGTADLRRRFSSLADRQEKLIFALQRHDFSSEPTALIRSAAEALDNIVRDERQMLRDVRELGSEIRYWWNKWLYVLERQVEHLDSIAESLHIAADDEFSSLMGAAISQIAQ